MRIEQKKLSFNPDEEIKSSYIHSAISPAVWPAIDETRQFLIVYRKVNSFYPMHEYNSKSLTTKVI